MSATLVTPPICPTCGASTQIPGPVGPAGAAGTNGSNGANAFTTLTAPFTMPAELATDTATVADSSWVSVGQVVHLNPLGYFMVVAAPSSTQVTLENLMDTPNSAYMTNFPPGNIAPAGNRLVPAGMQGIQGPSGVAGTLNSISPTTTRGDLILDDGANTPTASNVRLGTGGAGGNYKVLHADSAQATGVRWTALDMAGTNTSISGVLPVANGGTGGATAAAARAALAAAKSGANSDITSLTGLTTPLSIAQGGTGFGAKQSALNNLCSATVPTAGDALVFDGVDWLPTSLSNVLQRVSSSTSTASAASTTIPEDDTIPQIGEGTEILTRAITPLSASSTLVIEAVIPCCSSTTASILAAIFVDAVASAIAATAIASPTASLPNRVHIIHQVTSGSTSARTYRLRMGTSSGAEFAINGVTLGAGAVREFGGVQTAWMTVTEYA